MEARIQNDVFVDNNFDLLDKVINEARFREAYVVYASEQFMHKENFDQLSKANKKFHDLINKLLGDERLNGKDILSYVVAPIQRLSRYKLLVDALIKRLTDEDLVLQGSKLSQDIDQVPCLLFDLKVKNCVHPISPFLLDIDRGESKSRKAQEPKRSQTHRVSIEIQNQVDESSRRCWLK